MDLLPTIQTAVRKRKLAERKAADSRAWLAARNHGDLSKVAMDRPEWGNGTVAPTPIIRHKRR